MLDDQVIHPDLYENYRHYYSKIEDIGYIGNVPHLSCEDVLDAHYLICDHFYRIGEGIAGFGPRDFGLLSSAVARQVASAGGDFVYNGIWEISASLVFGLINDHPFHDGNKRTAFLSCVFFMMENGYTLSVDVSVIEDYMVEIAECKRRDGVYMSVFDIANRVRTMFRKVDSKIAYVVTFRELNSLLRERGCSLGDPGGNYINVYKQGSRVAQIGFPGWTREVTRNAISTVRKSTGLVPANGVDAQVFFKGADPISTLIGEYEAPLMRLAYR